MSYREIKLCTRFRRLYTAPMNDAKYVHKKSWHFPNGQPTRRYRSVQRDFDESLRKLTKVYGSLRKFDK